MNTFYPEIERDAHFVPRDSTSIQSICNLDVEVKLTSETANSPDFQLVVFDRPKIIKGRIVRTLSKRI